MGGYDYYITLLKTERQRINYAKTWGGKCKDTEEIMSLISLRNKKKGNVAEAQWYGEVAWNKVGG